VHCHCSLLLVASICLVQKASSLTSVEICTSSIPAAFSGWLPIDWCPATLFCPRTNRRVHGHEPSNVHPMVSEQVDPHYNECERLSLLLLLQFLWFNISQFEWICFLAAPTSRRCFLAPFFLAESGPTQNQNLGREDILVWKLTAAPLLMLTDFSAVCVHTPTSALSAQHHQHRANITNIMVLTWCQWCPAFSCFWWPNCDRSPDFQRTPFFLAWESESEFLL
jgi:hypothetical protein